MWTQELRAQAKRVGEKVCFADGILLAETVKVADHTVAALMAALRDGCEIMLPATRKRVDWIRSTRALLAALEKK